jgi:FlaG/FlaF family flagellin (archaellin)
MFRSKRAVEPLIAAVLLIVITVGIGAVVVGIVRNYIGENKAQIEGKSSEIACSRDVVLDVLEIDGVPQICNTSNYINIVMENQGTQIDDMQLMVMGESGLYTNSSILTSAFTQGQTIEVNAGFNPAGLGPILQVKFVPKLKRPGSTTFNFCSDVALKFEDLKSC